MFLYHYDHYTAAVYISQLLNVTPTLQYLHMDYNDIGDEGMAIILEALQQSKSLRVGECGLSVKGTVAGVYHVANMINFLAL